MGPGAGGLHQLGGHHPAGGRPEESRSGRDREAGAAGAPVVEAIRLLDPHVGQEPREKGPVHGLRLRRPGGGDHVEVVGDVAQLAAHILPLSHPPVAQELLPAQPAEPARRSTPALPLQVVPQGQPAQEVRALDVEASVGPGRRLLLPQRALPRILDREGGHDRRHLSQRAVAVGLHQHPAQAGVDR